jgi:hypothetical protein
MNNLENKLISALIIYEILLLFGTYHSQGWKNAQAVQNANTGQQMTHAV